MPMWRCPHCGTPQAETARCWVCRRSSTACGTCRNFRRSVAGSLGYCGLDRRRQPLAGDEIRECWEAGPGSDGAALATSALAEAAAAATTTVTPTAGFAAEAGQAARLEFIEVPGRLAPEPVLPNPASASRNLAPSLPSSDSPAFVPPPVGSTGEPGWSLWGDLDR